MLAIIGLILGVALALVFRPEMPPWLQPYLPIMIVAALDALVGAARAPVRRRPSPTRSSRSRSSRTSPSRR